MNTSATDTVKTGLWKSAISDGQRQLATAHETHVPHRKRPLGPTFADLLLPQSVEQSIATYLLVRDQADAAERACWSLFEEAYALRGRWTSLIVDKGSPEYQAAWNAFYSADLKVGRAAFHVAHLRSCQALCKESVKEALWRERMGGDSPPAHIH